MKEIFKSIYGTQAREIADDLGLKMSGEAIWINAVVHVKYKSIEGRPKVMITIKPKE